MSSIINLVGQRFGRLTVIEMTSERKRKSVVWLCECDCGNMARVSSKHLRGGAVRSCGCFKEETRGNNFLKHGATGTRLHGIWRGMLNRCYNSNDHTYANYGKRGVTVCDEWRNDFLTFQQWAVSSGYDDSLTLDRKDVDGNYEPSNCRWATNIEQQNNKRNTVWIEYNGETRSLSEWATRTGLTRNALWKRLYVEGWSVERALTTPLTVRNRK